MEYVDVLNREEVERNAARLYRAIYAAKGVCIAADEKIEVHIEDDREYNEGDSFLRYHEEMDRYFGHVRNEPIRSDLAHAYAVVLLDGDCEMLYLLLSESAMMDQPRGHFHIIGHAMV